MKASIRQVEGVAFLDLSGRIKLGEGSSLLREIVNALLSKGQKYIRLNLGDISYIDSSGIGELVSAFTSVRNQGRPIDTAAPNQESARSAADHQALHCLRRERRRSGGYRGICLVPRSVSGVPFSA